MKQTINLPGLISRLSAQTETPPADVRRFLHELFSEIENRLAAGESIEIAGLGQFVRGSDLTTPVMFKAEEAIAEKINEPFAAFSAVELNSGALEELETPEPQPAQEPQLPQDPQPSQLPQEPEPEPAQEPQLPQDPHPSQLPPEPEPEPQPAQEPQLPQDPQPSQLPQQSKTANWQWFTIGALAGIILGMAAGYFAGKTMGELSLPGENDIFEEEIEIIPEDITPSEPAQESQLPQEPQPSQLPQKPEPEPIYDVIGSKRFLTTMAGAHYGNKNYWVFIYEANPQLGNPNNISVGTKILIPAKESFAEASDDQTNAKAQKLLNQINQKYKL